MLTGEKHTTINHIFQSDFLSSSHYACRQNKNIYLWNHNQHNESYLQVNKSPHASECTKIDLLEFECRQHQALISYLCSDQILVSGFKMEFLVLLRVILNTLLVIALPRNATHKIQTERIIVHLYFCYSKRCNKNYVLFIRKSYFKISFILRRFKCQTYGNFYPGTETQNVERNETYFEEFKTVFINCKRASSVRSRRQKCKRF